MGDIIGRDIANLGSRYIQCAERVKHGACKTESGDDGPLKTGDIARFGWRGKLFCRPSPRFPLFKIIMLGLDLGVVVPSLLVCLCTPHRQRMLTVWTGKARASERKAC